MNQERRFNDDVTPSYFTPETVQPMGGSSGDLKTCELLLKRGTSVNAKNRFGYTPLHVAAGNGHFKVVSYLLKRNANPLLRSEQGLMPIHTAAASGSLRQRATDNRLRGRCFCGTFSPSCLHSLSTRFGFTTQPSFLSIVVTRRYP